MNFIIGWIQMVQDQGLCIIIRTTPFSCFTRSGQASQLASASTALFPEEKGLHKQGGNSEASILKNHQVPSDETWLGFSTAYFKYSICIQKLCMHATSPKHFFLFPFTFTVRHSECEWKESLGIHFIIQYIFERTYMKVKVIRGRTQMKLKVEFLTTCIPYYLISYKDVGFLKIYMF